MQSVRRNEALELGDAAKPGHFEIRGDICQRIQNEVALHYTRMGQREIGRVATFPPVNQEVEVDHSRAPLRVPLGPAERRLDRSQTTQESERIQSR
jgi:hypothetical protein